MKNKFKDYKEKQRYYEDKYKNRGTTIWISKVVGKGGKVLKTGSTYTKGK